MSSRPIAPSGVGAGIGSVAVQHQFDRRFARVVTHQLESRAGDRSVARRIGEQDDAVGLPQALARPGRRVAVGDVDHEVVRLLDSPEPLCRMLGLGAVDDQGSQAQCRHAPRKGTGERPHRQFRLGRKDRDGSRRGERRYPVLPLSQPFDQQPGDGVNRGGVIEHEAVECRLRHADDLAVAQRQNCRRARFAGQHRHFADGFAGAHAPHQAIRAGVVANEGAQPS